ncbi:glutathione S-transferase [Sphingomonas sp. Leaf357]|uniref:glutathione S-transferase family protein n=1 Tax=Sphingomonas sp. Leaf357 TaxID=1736350 RepID=UPI0006F7C3A6|nr:glutathione S-transferase family protein [Sphingomonas sp. Leaf357]KQS04032.1 glutathione S-transferase [Sphingomonas sp. Leaf357]
MTLTLYTNPMSRGRIARWMIEETGAEYDTVILDWGKTKSQDFLAINPMGKVPTIVHDGKVVTEGAAICAYLADAFPEAGLAPPTADRADYYRWLFYAAGPIEQAVTNRSLGVAPDERQQMMAGYGNYDLVVKVLQDTIGQRDYIAGDRFTAADVYFGSQIAWGTQFGSLPKSDVFDAYVARITARPAYKRAGEIDDALIAAAQGQGADADA